LPELVQDAAEQLSDAAGHGDVRRDQVQEAFLQTTEVPVEFSNSHDVAMEVIWIAKQPLLARDDVGQCCFVRLPGTPCGEWLMKIPDQRDCTDA